MNTYEIEFTITFTVPAESKEEAVEKAYSEMEERSVNDLNIYVDGKLW